MSNNKHKVCRKELDHALVVQAQNGDAAAKSELVDRHINLIHSIAGKFRRRQHLHEDLVQDGICGLLIAINRFNVDNDVHFATYAMHYIRAAMIDAITQGLNKDKNTIKAYWHGPRVYERLWKNGDGDPSYEDVAQQLDVDPSCVASVHSALMPTVVTEYEDLNFADTAENAEDKLIRESEARQVRQAVAKLPQQEYTVINRRFKEDRDSLQVAGDEIGLSRESARLIEAKALKLLKRDLTKKRRSEGVL